MSVEFFEEGERNVLLVDEFRRFLKIRDSLAPSGALAPYEWNSKHRWYGAFLVYSEMLNEHARELANSLNEFGRHVRTLEAWANRFSEIEDINLKFDLMLEFVEPVSIVAINLPYVIRSRFIYSTSHLCHQANKIRSDDWIDNFPLDKDVWFESADKSGATWKRYKKLKLSLEKIAGKDFGRMTSDFRNSYNHRYSARVEFGLSNIVNRLVDHNGKISYGIGQTEPLKLVIIVDQLKQQHSLAMAAFNCYQELIKEQIAEIEKWENDSGVFKGTETNSIPVDQ